MQNLFRPRAARAAMWAALTCAIASSQTMVDMRSQARNIDFSGAISTRPFPVGTVLPPICAVGQTFFKADAPAGRNLYMCVMTDSWSVVDGSQQTLTPGATGALVVNSGTIDINPSIVTTSQGNNAFTGNNDFGAAASLRVKVMSAKPAATDCDASSEAGRVVLRTPGGTAATVLYLCQETGPGTFAWKASSYSYGSSKPQACDAGELYFDIGAPAGQQWFGCVSANTWANLGGAGGAALPSQAGNGGKLLGSDGSVASWRTIAGFTDDGSRLTPDGTVVGMLGGNNVWTGHQHYPASATQMLTAQTDRIVCNRRTVAIAAAAPLALTSTATILDGADGQVCVVANVGDAGITLQDQDALPASNLQLAGTDVTIPAKGQITLQFNATIGDWVQDGIPGTIITGGDGGSSSGLQDTTAMGMVARIGGSGTTAARVITGVNGISVANGDGVAGDPQISLPGASKGDIIVHNGTDNVRQAAGSDGQTLIADSTRSNGLKWATRAVTGANGVSVSNGDWSADDAATVAIPGVSKGDIIVHDGATNTRMPVGVDGQVLMADSSQAAGVKWGAAATGGGGATIPTYGGPGGGNPWMYLTTGNLVLANQTVASNANTISVVAMYVDREVKFTKMSFRKANNVAGATGEVAIYNSAGIKIATTGVIDWSTGATQVVAYPCASTTLTPGTRYYLAWSADSSSAQIAGASLGQFHAVVMNQAALPEATFFTASEAYASGLPGSISTANLQRFNNAIVMGVGLIQ